MKNQMPEKWKYLKADLFDNATVEDLKEGKRRLKLSFSIKTYEGADWLYFRGAMNSPRKCYKRFVQEDWDWRHYNTVLKHYDQIRKQPGVERVNISKLYQKGWAESKHTIEGLSAMLIHTADGYVVQLYVKDMMVSIDLDTHNLSTKQRKQNVIASASISNDTGYARKRVDDFI